MIFSILGDAFLEDESGNVYWLDTGYGELKHAAPCRKSFFIALGGKDSEYWLLPPLVEQLHACGKIPTEGQCYSFTIFPIFSQGKYTAENMFVVSAKEHFSWSADLHNQIHNLPDGTKVKIAIATPGRS